MATSLLALLDDITTLLDDVAAMTKVAAHKTAGVLGDDLALNAQQVTGVRADRELPVVWAVAKGSMLNKAILVPAALAISAFAPWAITPLLMAGGTFLCFEGFEKLAHRRLSGRAGHETAPSEAIEAATGGDGDRLAFEKLKVQGAIRTDFILSAEIITISLGTVASAPFVEQLMVLALVALVMTAGVYGAVAGIVKLDDLGLYLMRQGAAAAQALGRAVLRVTPWLMRALSVAGTAAMFLVGGGIVAHGLPFLHPLTQALEAFAGSWNWLIQGLANGVLGVAIGALALGAWTLVQRLRGKSAGH